ncbi:hypothetical protein SPBR_07243 [Sporothrix brasiliensis 5110]|uniref:RING-type domain-containing protein n=1 Tax=Sporothrix brasiliensis 5110 TaxID=1398154 RepID=A0A0C2FEQ9_9PEZI|nr:uncharacterized protein SPBR_07243 [Sporothrix brasiliensis 5110]KIH89613.1 hypothetical protein SPBR_07243 [Sporothrix brasiliensis 5110]
MPAEAPASAGPSQERRASARRFSRRDGMVSPNYGDSHPYDGSTSEGSDSEVLPPPYVVIPYSDFAENSVRQAQARVRDEPTERARHFVHNRGMFRSKSLFSLMKPVKIDDLEEDDRMCIICYNDFGVCAPEGIVEHPLRMPKCNHVFGHHCIRRWLVQHNTCPYCRGRIEDPTTDGHRSASGSFRRFNANLPFSSPSQSSRFPYHRSGLFASSDVRTPTTSTAAGSSTGTARTDDSTSSSRHTAVGERRPASSMDSSEQPPRQRARTRHVPSRSSAAAVGTYPHNTLHIQGNLQMQRQPPPTSHASMPTFWHVPFNGMQSPPGQLPPNPFLSASDQPNDYSVPLRRPSHPMQGAQTLHTHAASSSINSNSNSNNNGGPNMPAWGMPVLPLPTASSTAGLPANASRPVYSTPFNHQLPLSLQPMPTPSFVSNPGMQHTQQPTAMSASAQTSPVVTQLQDLATETNTSSHHTAP